MIAEESEKKDEERRKSEKRLGTYIYDSSTAVTTLHLSYHKSRDRCSDTYVVADHTRIRTEEATLKTKERMLKLKVEEETIKRDDAKRAAEEKLKASMRSEMTENGKFTACNYEMDSL